MNATKRKIQKRVKRRIIFATTASVLIIAVFCAYKIIDGLFGQSAAFPAAYSTYGSILNLNDYPKELVALLDRNPETFDFVKSYPYRDALQSNPIDISEDFTPGTVPLFIQWDIRWGWNTYGNDIIALAGCGPTCLSMAYVYFTEDVSMNPRTMAAYVYEQGYYTSEGTAWNLWTKGVSSLGLKGREVPLDESVMKRALDNGELLICSMRPGDFTTQGHILLIWGYGEDGFYVNDPNSRENSSLSWSYSRLSKQIKGMWALSD